MTTKQKRFIVLVADGMADYPIPELGGRTPLEAARTPHMDFLAQHGKVGRARFVPEGMTPGSDVANLAIFGYDPQKYFPGRAPFEAINMGINLQEDEVAFRCNLVTIEQNALADYSAGHISTKEAQEIIKFLNSRMGNERVRFHPGVSYRHLAIIKGNTAALLALRCAPPHDIMGQDIATYMPRSRADDVVAGLMERSRELLSSHEINHVRIDLKENPANMIWLWGQGKRIQLPLFTEKYGLRGAVISAVDLIKGIGRAIGLEPLSVPGATGYYDTNYEGKAAYALKSLEKKPFVFVHVEAPDEAGHNGDLRAKISAIENFDRMIVGPILEKYKDTPGVRILVLPDHPTPLALKTHTADPVCFVIYGEGVVSNKAAGFSEAIAEQSDFKFTNGHELMDSFVTAKTL